MEFVIILIGVIFLSIVGFIQMHIYAQIKLKTTILIIVLVVIAFMIIMVNYFYKRNL